MLTNEDLASYLGDHAPFQTMAPDALADLAAAASVRQYDAGAVIVDYSEQEPGEIWLLCSGQVVLLVAGPDGDEPFDTVPPGGLFGFFPLLTGGGMEFDARATVPSTLIRLPGAPVRAQFARPAGLGVPGVVGVEHPIRRAPRDRLSATDNRARSANSCTATCSWCRRLAPPCVTRWCR